MHLVFLTQSRARRADATRMRYTRTRENAFRVSGEMAPKVLRQGRNLHEFIAPSATTASLFRSPTGTPREPPTTSHSPT